MRQAVQNRGKQSPMATFDPSSKEQLEQITAWRPSWYENPQLTAAMLEQLCQHHFFKNLPAARDMMMEQHGQTLEEANRICLLTGLATFKDEFDQLLDLQHSLGTMLFGAEPDVHWLEDEFVALHAALEARKILDATAEVLS